MTPVQSVVTVTTAGTPVQLPTASSKVVAIYIEPLATNTDPGYVGISATMSSSTGAGVIARITADTPFSIAVPDARSALNPRDYYLDSDGDSQKFLVTYWLA